MYKRKSEQTLVKNEYLFAFKTFDMEKLPENLFDKIICNN